MMLNLVNSKFVFVILCISVSGCAQKKKITDEFHVFIDQVEWVKLLPYEPNEEGQFKVRTGCGRAEVKFSDNSKLFNTAMLWMGEWCETPHTSLSVDQVFIIDKSAKLIDYFIIQYGQKKNEGIEYIDLLDAYKPIKSVLLDLLRPLKNPILMGEIEEGDLRAYDRYINSGIIIVKDGFLYLNKVVYIEDIRSTYHLD